MEPVYCPNGHPNRPGTRICAVCRELLAPSTPVSPPRKLPPRPPGIVVPPPRPAAPPQSSPGLNEPSPVEKSAPAPAPAPKSRLWLWLLLFLLILVGGVAMLLALFYPTTRVSTGQPTVVTEVMPAVVATSETSTSAPTLTQGPAPTDVPPPTDSPPTVEVSPTAVATITPLPTIVGVVVTPTIAFGPEANFIQNGSFNDDWANGWTRETRGGTGSVDVRPLAGEPETQAVHLEWNGPGMLRLAQRVVLTFPVEGLVFRGRFRLAGASGSEGEGRGAIILRYEDANGEAIGASVWLDDAADSTELWGTAPLPPFGPTLSARFIDEAWQTVELRLGQEITEELPDVNMEEVRQITIFLALLGSESCSSADCGAMLEAAELSLTAEGP